MSVANKAEKTSRRQVGEKDEKIEVHSGEDTLKKSNRWKSGLLEESNCFDRLDRLQRVAAVVKEQLNNAMDAVIQKQPNNKSHESSICLATILRIYIID